VRNHVLIANNAYDAAKDSHALVICTEWDEFKVKKKIFFLND
jgi:UDP-glucose 6-dehydrogenase